VSHAEAACEEQIVLALQRLGNLLGGRRLWPRGVGDGTTKTAG
jgi:hypothetical protein